MSRLKCINSDPYCFFFFALALDLGCEEGVAWIGSSASSAGLEPEDAADPPVLSSAAGLRLSIVRALVTPLTVLTDRAAVLALDALPLALPLPLQDSAGGGLFASAGRGGTSIFLVTAGAVGAGGGVAAAGLFLGEVTFLPFSPSASSPDSTFDGLY